MWALKVSSAVLIALIILPIVFCAIIQSDNQVRQLPNNVPAKLEQFHTSNTSLSVMKDAQIRESRSYYRQTPTGNMTQPSQPKKKTDLMSKILPLMIMPFLISSSMIPMMLTSLKFMLLKSLFVGKIAIFLMALNAFWKTENKGGVYSHNINVQPDQKDLHMAHYGYGGDEEYGAYVNRRSNPYR